MNAIKPQVKLYGTRPEMAIVHAVVCSVFNKYGIDCVITSGVGMKHGDKSLHPVGLAHDYRTKHINNDVIKQQIIDDMKKVLPCCDIILEYDGAPQEHLHVEFDDHNDHDYQLDKKAYKDSGEWPKQ